MATLTPAIERIDDISSFIPFCHLTGYAQPLASVGDLAAHRILEAMKNAFAMRMGLGDPGPCTSPDNCFLNVTALLADMLSPSYAATLRSLSQTLTRNVQ